MKDKRKPGQSQLDYLWTNYGYYSVSDKLEDETIPSSKLLKNIAEQISNESLTDIKIINNYLVGFNKLGDDIFSLDITDIISKGKTIVEFGKKYVEENSKYEVGTPVYFLKFSDDSELIVPIDNYSGSETKSIVVTLKNDQIFANLKINNQNTIVPIMQTDNGIRAELLISEDQESIQLTKDLEGLKAKIILDNSGLSLKFKYLSLEDYNSLEQKDPTTVYFIKDKSYFYFGENIIGKEQTTLDNYYTKQEIDENLATKEYISEQLSNAGFSWKSI